MIEIRGDEIRYYGDTIYEGISISKRKKVLPLKKFSKSSDLISECSYDCDYCLGCNLKPVLKNKDLKSSSLYVI